MSEQIMQLLNKILQTMSRVLLLLYVTVALLDVA